MRLGREHTGSSGVPQNHRLGKLPSLGFLKVMLKGSVREEQEKEVGPVGI